MTVVLQGVHAEVLIDQGICLLLFLVIEPPTEKQQTKASIFFFSTNSFISPLIELFLLFCPIYEMFFIIFLIIVISYC